MSLVSFLNANPEIVSWAAGLCTTVCYLPQSIKTLRTRKVRDISLPMYVLLFSGVFLWTTFGVLIGSTAMVIWNGISLAFIFSILMMKIFYEVKDSPIVSEIVE